MGGWLYLGILYCYGLSYVKADGIGVLLGVFLVREGGRGGW